MILVDFFSRTLALNPSIVIIDIATFASSSIRVNHMQLLDPKGSFLMYPGIEPI